MLFGIDQVAEPVYISVDSLGSDVWKLDQIIELLKNGAVGVIPTDTVYVSLFILKEHLDVKCHMCIFQVQKLVMTC